MKIKLVGLGGVGSIVARYLSLYLVAKKDPNNMLFLVDGDAFEEKNTERMIFSWQGNKAEVVRDDLTEMFGNDALAIMPITKYVNPDNVKDIIEEGDLVILCVDNHATRKLVSDRCAELREAVLVSGGNDGVGEDSTGAQTNGTYGNVQVYVRMANKDMTPSLSEYHPEIREPADKRPDDESCLELLNSVPQILFANLAVASAILNAVYLVLNGDLHYGEVCFDIREARMAPAPWPHNLGGK